MSLNCSLWVKCIDNEYKNWSAYKILYPPTQKQKLSVVSHRFQEIVHLIPKLEIYLNPSVEADINSSTSRVLPMKRLKMTAGKGSSLVHTVLSRLPHKNKHNVWMNINLTGTVYGPDWDFYGPQQ